MVGIPASFTPHCRPPTVAQRSGLTMKSFSFVMSLVLVASTSPPGLRAADEPISDAVTTAAAVVNAEGQSPSAAAPTEVPGYVKIVDSWSTSPDELFRPVSFQDVAAPDVATPDFQASTVNRGRRQFVRQPQPVECQPAGTFESARYEHRARFGIQRPSDN